MDFSSPIPYGFPKKYQILQSLMTKSWFLSTWSLCSLPSLLTKINACDYIKKKLEDDNSLSSRTKLDVDEIMSLLNFVPSDNYFMFNDKIYKQIHGCAMGGPVSPVVANLCMEEIEESAIIASTVPPKVWKRYVDDSFCIIKKDEIPTFHNTLNSMDSHISFTIEQENNGQISFLDTLISRKNGTNFYKTSTENRHIRTGF